MHWCKNITNKCERNICFLAIQEKYKEKKDELLKTEERKFWTDLNTGNVLLVPETVCQHWCKIQNTKATKYFKVYWTEKHVILENTLDLL